jgi:hypothetical protein
MPVSIAPAYTTYCFACLRSSACPEDIHGVNMVYFLLLIFILVFFDVLVSAMDSSCWKISNEKTQSLEAEQ